MPGMRIIACTGTLGAGKGAVVDYLVKQHDFNHLSVRSYLKELLSETHPTIEIDRGALTTFANQLRTEHGPAYLVEQLYERAIVLGKDSIIESVRTPGEIFALRSLTAQRQQPCLLLAVDAPAQLRYDRIVERKSETDSVTFEQFQQDEAREMHNDDPNKQVFLI